MGYLFCEYVIQTCKQINGVQFIKVIEGQEYLVYELGNLLAFLKHTEYKRK